jgi:hypothetical protein
MSVWSGVSFGRSRARRQRWLWWLLRLLALLIAVGLALVYAASLA